jgi:transcription elongation factor GreA
VPRPKEPSAVRAAPRREPSPAIARQQTTEAEARYLSAEGIARLREELEQLTSVRRPEVVARIKAAKELGDLKENSDYTAAREEQSFLEGRIAQVEGLLRSAVVIEAPGVDGRVHVGSTVAVEEIPDGSVVEYRIVGSAEADPAAGRISNASPVGRALVGRSVGETVTVTTPRGDVAYRIVAVG